jgi:Leucine-rich repeat (LRR) protein
MNVVVASERLNILGGVWTPKLISSFQEGDVSHPFHVEGRVEIKELGGHMKLFMTDMSIEPHPLNLLEEDKEEIKTEYRKQFQLKIEHMIETGEDPPNDTQMIEIEERELPELYETRLKQMERDRPLPNRLFVYLTRRKPKPKMNDAHNQGTRIHCPSQDGSGLFGKPDYSLGTFQAPLKDIPDPLAYGGVVVLKLPNDFPKTDFPVIYGYARFQSAKNIKVNTHSAIGIQDLGDQLKKILEMAQTDKPKKKASDELKPTHYYNKKSIDAWAKFHMPLDEEVEFPMFMKMLDSVNIFLCEAQAWRIFKAVDIDGSGEVGASEFENFLMAYDILGHGSADLACLDIYESLALKPSEKFGEFSNHEGLDMSGFMEAVEMLGTKQDLNDEDLVRAFQGGKKLPADEIYLKYPEFKKAWLKIADLKKEFVSRKLKYDPSSLAQARLRDRMYRIITDQEESYMANLAKINDVVEDVKQHRRHKKDEKKREKAGAKEALLHAAAKFQALRGQEKRLMAKVAEEEKTKKRGEERALRTKLMAQQKEARAREVQEINEKSRAGDKLRSDEIKAQGLDRLDMSVKQMRFLPTSLNDTMENQTKLTYLQTIDFSHNILEKFPEKDFMYWLNSLRNLKLSQNRLKKLPDNEIQYMIKLEILEVDNNRLETFPDLCSHLTALQRLDLSNNKLKNLPEGIGLCSNLKFFKAHSNEIQLLPNSIGGCFRMEYLDISRNKIREFPEDISYMASLTHIDASQNRVGHLPHDVGNCMKLTYLDLSANIMVFLPESFSKLSNLEILNLERNEMILQPDRFLNCTSLKDLRMKGNSTRHITADIGACKSLMRFDASSNMIETIPTEIGLMTALEELDLSYNALTTIPPELASCGMVQYLHLRNNSIEGCLPQTIGLVESLVTVDISFNKVTELPESIIGLHLLESFKAERCQLSSLPDTMTCLENLHLLDLQNNRFTRFPVELMYCKSLKELDLRNNSISLLPKKVCGMSILNRLDLSRNLLKALPVEFCEVLESVEDVKLDSNPWSDLPPKWGKLWEGKHATDGPGGWAVADAVDFLYGMASFYDCADDIWKDHGVFHYTNRLGFGDFLDELRKRIPNKWHEGLVDHVKTIYFQARSGGVFPRWYSMEGHDTIKEERAQFKVIDDARRNRNVELAREGALAKDERMRKAYDVAPILRAQRQGAQMSEHSLNQQVILNMEAAALQHCNIERDIIAEKRIKRREAKMLKKETHEMERLREILDTDREAYIEEMDPSGSKRRRDKKRAKANAARAAKHAREEKEMNNSVSPLI